MFRHVGETVIRRNRIILLFWIAISVLANGMMGGWLNRLKVFPFAIPHWNDVAKTGEFQFLPGTLFPYTTLFRSIGRASCRERV